MKNIPYKLIAFFFLLSFVSCNNDDDSTSTPGNTYPKAVQITYKVTSANSTTLQAISYKNETGGMTTLTNVSLPYSKTVSRTVNKNDDASIGYSSTNTSSNVTLEISVGTSKKSQNFVAGTGALTYSFQ